MGNTSDKALTLRVGGVPEHFNAPWYIALEQGDFASRPYDVSWEDFHSGSGAMCDALERGDLDVAVLLTDGIVSAILSGHTSRIIGTYVDSPLYWGIHVDAESRFTRPEELAGELFAISRPGSGSHLMTFVEAEARGWLNEQEPRFVTVENVQGAKRALKSGEASGFLWERLMTRPMIDSGLWRQIGVRPSPWPAFLIAARPEIIADYADLLQDMMVVVQRRCHEMKAARERTRSFIAERFELAWEEVDSWLDETRWRCAPEVASLGLEDTIETLHRVGVIERRASVEELVAQSVCELGQVLPAALYDLRVAGVRDALSRAGRAFGTMHYEDLARLGEFDRYYDYGTASCQEAARLLGLREGRHVLEIGSRVGAIARYLSHHFGSQVTGVEIQPALNAVARDLTSRCGMGRQVRFITGDITSIELERHAFDHFVSMMVVLHLKDRVSAWENVFPSLKPGATVLIEDLVLRAPDALSAEHQEFADVVLAAPNLVTVEEHIRELERGGLVDVEVQDMTEAWTAWSAERYEQFLSERDLHLSVHGAEVFESRALFLQIMRDFFKEGLIGSARFTARKRGELEAHLVRARSWHAGRAIEL